MGSLKINIIGSVLAIWVIIAATGGLILSGALPVTPDMLEKFSDINTAQFMTWMNTIIIPIIVSAIVIGAFLGFTFKEKDNKKYNHIMLFRVFNSMTQFLMVMAAIVVTHFIMDSAIITGWKTAISLAQTIALYIVLSQAVLMYGILYYYATYIYAHILQERASECKEMPVRTIQRTLALYILIEIILITGPIIGLAFLFR